MNIEQVFVCVILIAILVKIIDNIKNKKLYQLLEQFPSLPTYPLIGSGHLLLGSSDGLLANLEKILQPFDRLVAWIGPIPVIILKKHHDIATVLAQSLDRELLEVPDQWMGLGMINAKYEEWKKSRKMLAPAFTSDMLTKYALVFNKNSSNLVERLKSVADTDQEVDISHWLLTASLDSILENSIGIRNHGGEKLGEDFCNAMLEGMKDVARRFQWPFLLIHYVYMIYLKITGKIEFVNQLQRLPTKIVKDELNNARNLQSLKSDAGYNDEDSSKTMLDLLIKKGLNESNFNETRIRNELLQLIGAGTETTALNLSFLILMLAINQDIQQKVYEEISQLDDPALTMNDLTDNLEYLERCVKETLRMYSPAIVTSRRTHKEIKLKDNTIIPSNMFVVTFIHFANYDTDLYANPQKWDPEHFNEQAIKERPKTSQLSFGYGPRSCIGTKYAMLSVKTQITHILRKYHLSTSIKEFPNENLKADISIRSKIGFPVKFTTRQEVKHDEKN